MAWWPCLSQLGWDWDPVPSHFGDLPDDLGEPPSHPGRQIVHRQPFSRRRLDFVEDLPSPADPFFVNCRRYSGSPLQAAHHDDPSAPYQRPSAGACIPPAGAGDLDDAHVGRVLQSHRTCQVRGGISSVVAANPTIFGSNDSIIGPQYKVLILALIWSVFKWATWITLAGHSEAQVQRPGTGPR